MAIFGYQPTYNAGNLYQPYQQHYQMQQSQPQQDQQTTNRWAWVQGELGAKSYLVAPNTTVLLLDSEGKHFYLKSADASGMPLPLRVFEYTETTQTVQTAEIPQAASNDTEYAKKADLDALAARLDKLTPKEATNDE